MKLASVRFSVMSLACALAFAGTLAAQIPTGGLITPSGLAVAPPAAQAAQAGQFSLPVGVVFHGGGVMFDLVNLNANPLTVLSFDDGCNTGNNSYFDWQIWTKAGTYSTALANQAAWTLVGTLGGVPTQNIPSIPVNAYGVHSHIPIPVNVTITPGATQAFWVTTTTPSPVTLYTYWPNGSGLALASNADLQINRGLFRLYGGLAAPFTSPYVAGSATPNAACRGFDGRINYGPVPIVDYQVNSLAAYMDINGVLGNANLPAVTHTSGNNSCTFGATVVTFASTQVNFDWDVGITFSPSISVAQGATVLAGSGLIVNLNFGDPNFFFINGGGPFAGGPLGTSFFPGNFSVPFAPGAPLDVTGQMVTIDPSNIFNFVALSQASTVSVALTTAAIQETLSDDTAIEHSFADPRLCGSLGSMNFYGVNHTGFGVNMNGRVTFGLSPSPNDWVPSVTGTTTNSTLVSADAGIPFVGCWCDFNPALVLNGATVTVDSGAVPGVGIITIAYTNVPYYGQPGLTSNFSFVLDQNTGTVSIYKPAAFPVLAGNPMYMGVTPGAVALVSATDPGPALWAFGPNFGPGLASDMHYEFGNADSLATGIVQLDFVYNAVNYDVNAF